MQYIKNLLVTYITAVLRQCFELNASFKNMLLISRYNVHHVSMLTFTNYQLTQSTAEFC